MRCQILNLRVYHTTRNNLNQVIGARNNEWLPYLFARFVLSAHFDGHGIMNGFPTPMRIFRHRNPCMRRVGREAIHYSVPR